MALQSCAMAFGDSSDDGCLHCPPALSGDISSNGTHETDRSDLGASPCDTNVSQCAIADDFNYDGRAAKIKDAPTEVLVGIALPSADIPLEIAPSSLLDIGDHPHRPGGPPPLNVLYCVYLI